MDIKVILHNNDEYIIEMYTSMIFNQENNQVTIIGEYTYEFSIDEIFVIDFINEQIIVNQKQ